MKPILISSLRYPRAWFLFGVLLAIAITVVSLVPARQLPGLGISDKVEHVIAYLVLTFWFASVVARYDYAWLALALLLFGALIEVAQELMGLGREADVLDLVADAVGIAIGLALAATPLGNWAKLVEERLPARSPEH